MDKYFKSSNIIHNIYSTNDVINNIKYYGDLIEDRYNKSRKLLFNKINTDQKYSDLVITHNNIEFFNYNTDYVPCIIIISIVICLVIIKQLYI